MKPFTSFFALSHLSRSVTASHERAIPSQIDLISNEMKCAKAQNTPKAKAEFFERAHKV
jgi:hypothetical protein